MFEDFLYLLRRNGLKISLTEWMSLMEALDKGAQVVICGRCYDPAAFAAPAIRAGYSEALATHLGKILECAAICATPGSASDCIMGYLGEDYFKVEPLNPIRCCTPPIPLSRPTLPLPPRSPWRCGRRSYSDPWKAG